MCLSRHMLLNSKYSISGCLSHIGQQNKIEMLANHTDVQYNCSRTASNIVLNIFFCLAVEIADNGRMPLFNYVLPTCLFCSLGAKLGVTWVQHSISWYHFRIGFCRNVVAWIAPHHCSQLKSLEKGEWLYYDDDHRYVW